MTRSFYQSINGVQEMRVTPSQGYAYEAQLPFLSCDLNLQPNVSKTRPSCFDSVSMNLPGNALLAQRDAKGAELFSNLKGIVILDASRPALATSQSVMAIALLLESNTPNRCRCDACDPNKDDMSAVPSVRPIKHIPRLEDRMC